MNELQSLLNDLFSYCYLYPDTIRLLTETEAGDLLAQHPQAKKMYSKLKHFSGYLNNDIGVESARKSAFSAVDVVCTAIQQAIEHGCTFIVIDCLQNVLIRGTGNTPTTAVSQLCIALQTIAAANNVTIVACSQLNREGVCDFKPSMYQFKDSSAIETSADFIYTLCEVPDPPPHNAGLKYSLNDSYHDVDVKHLLLSLVRNSHDKNSKQLELGFIGEYNDFFCLGTKQYLSLQRLFNCALHGIDFL